MKSLQSAINRKENACVRWSHVSDSNKCFYYNSIKSQETQVFMGIFNQFKYKMKSALSVYTPRIYIVQAKIQSNHINFLKGA